MDATDNRLLATRYYGCWVLDLYNRGRPHARLGPGVPDRSTTRCKAFNRAAKRCFRGPIPDAHGPPTPALAQSTRLFPARSHRVRRGTRKSTGKRTQVWRGSPVRCRARLGGLLKFYYREAVTLSAEFSHTTERSERRDAVRLVALHSFSRSPTPRPSDRAIDADPTVVKNSSAGDERKGVSTPYSCVGRPLARPWSTALSVALLVVP